MFKPWNQVILYSPRFVWYYKMSQSFSWNTAQADEMLLYPEQIYASSLTVRDFFHGGLHFHLLDPESLFYCHSLPFSSPLFLLCLSVCPSLLLSAILFLSLFSLSLFSSIYISLSLSLNKVWNQINMKKKRSLQHLAIW